jgi:hypothetical protein
MGNVIIYRADNGTLAVVYPSGEVAIEEVALRTVPRGVEFSIVDEADIPDVATRLRTKAELSEYAADKRRAVLNYPTPTPHGISWCDQGTRSDFGQIIQMLDEGLATEPVLIKLAGGFVHLTRSELIEVIIAVGAKVMLGFAVESAVLVDVESGEVQTFADVDEAYVQVNA